MSKRRRDPERMERKLSIAEENRKEREARTPEQQLALLDQRLGVEMGAKKERTRLISQIAERLGMNDKKSAESKKVPKNRRDRRKAKAEKYKRQSESS